MAGCLAELDSLKLGHEQLALLQEAREYAEWKRRQVDLQTVLRPEVAEV
jgi:hypothetical protein